MCTFLLTFIHSKLYICSEYGGKMTNKKDFFIQPISKEIWASKYQLKDKDGNIIEQDISDTFRRVSKKLSVNEENSNFWEEEFFNLMNSGKFIGAGRIISNAGAEKYKNNTSLINCTVMNQIPDSMEGIMQVVKESARTLQRGSGVGYDFSTIRPRGALVRGVGSGTSGPLSFMEIYDKMCFTIQSAGGRRGAQMGLMDCQHPDIMDYIKAKREDGKLRQFNLSVLITKKFMDSVINDQDWELWFWERKTDVNLETIETNLIKLIKKGDIPYNHSEYNYFQYASDHIEVEFGNINPNEVFVKKVYERTPAQKIWNLIMKSTYDFAEPGFILIDEVNKKNNLWWLETIRATNPCVSERTVVNTSNGYKTVKELIGKQFKVILHNKEHDTTEEGFFHTGKKKLYKLTTNEGNSIELTEEHKMLILDNDSETWVEAKNLKKGDLLIMNNTSSNKHVLNTFSSLEYIDTEDVYDVQVPGINAFDGNGFVCHNCGEQPLPPNGACLLGSMILPTYVQKPFTDDAHFDFDGFKKDIKVAARLLDNVVEFNGLPLENQIKEILEKRRHGMGFTGLGNTFSMLKVAYGSDKSIEITTQISKMLAEENYRAGVELGQEKGIAKVLDTFYPLEEKYIKRIDKKFDKKDIALLKKEGLITKKEVKGTVLHAASNYFDVLDYDLRLELALKGSRFTHATTIAPNGTVSLVSNNVSNGIEPPFMFSYFRNVIVEGNNSKQQQEVMDYSYLRYKMDIDPNATPDKLPDYFVSTETLTAKDHIAVQAAAQKYIDTSISKTINVKTDYPFEDFKGIYIDAYKNKLKGVTTFRFNPNFTTGVLVSEKNLKKTTYEFTLDDGSKVKLKGNEKVIYEGQEHVVSNLYDALKDGYYGKF
jgi:ribonucleotide reductase alpha subunit